MILSLTQATQQKNYMQNPTSLACLICHIHNNWGHHIHYIFAIYFTVTENLSYISNQVLIYRTKGQTFLELSGSEMPILCI